MNLLDCNLHGRILDSLAASLALSPAADSVSPDCFLEYVDDDHYGGASGADKDSYQFLSLSSVESATALCLYITTSPRTEENIARLRALYESTLVSYIEKLPNSEVQVYIGFEDDSEWPVVDQFAYYLVAAWVHIIPDNSLQVIFDVEAALVHALASPLVSHDRITTHLLPALNGISRALYKVQLRSNLPDVLSGCSRILEVDALSPLRSKDSVIDRPNWPGSSSSLILNSADSQASSQRMQRQVLFYATRLKGFSSSFVDYCLYGTVERALLSTVLDAPLSPELAWPQLAFSQISLTPASLADIDELEKRVTDIIELYSSQENEQPAPAYGLDIIAHAVKILTLLSLVRHEFNDQLIHVITGYLNLEAPAAANRAVLSDGDAKTFVTLQVGCLLCLSALGQAFPEKRGEMTRRIRAFIASPAPFNQAPCPSSPAAGPSLPGPDECGVPLQIAIRGYSSLVLADCPDTQSKQADIQLFANYYDGLSATSKNEAEEVSSSVNIVHAISLLARNFDDDSTYGLAVPMLIQRLPHRNATVNAAIYDELATLANTSDMVTFNAICKSFVSLLQNPAPGCEDMGITALAKLAKVASSRPIAHEHFLESLLSLFLSLGLQQSKKPVEKQARSQSLVKLLPIFSGFLSQAGLDPRSEFPSGIVPLFRNFWYLCLTNGFTAPRSRHAPYLQVIAQSTPCLLSGSGSKFVETELDYDVVLRQKDQLSKIDAIKADLASELANQSSIIRNLSVSHVLFLAAVLKVESLRSVALKPSMVLSYITHPGISQSSLYDPLVSLIGRVQLIFCAKLNEKVTSHSIPAYLPDEICRLLFDACYPLPKVHKVVASYLNVIISKFPSLFCNGEVISTALDILTTIKVAVDRQFTDRYTPQYEYATAGDGSRKLRFQDDYDSRQQLLTSMSNYVTLWLTAAVNRAPNEVHGILLEYIGSRGDQQMATALTSLQEHDSHSSALGVSLAMEISRVNPSQSFAKGPRGAKELDNSAQFAAHLIKRSYYIGQSSTSFAPEERASLVSEIQSVVSGLDGKSVLHIKLESLSQLLYRCGSRVIAMQEPDLDILTQVIAIPMRVFTYQSVALGHDIWTWIIDARPDLKLGIMSQVVEYWLLTIRQRRGFFSREVQRTNPLNEETQYNPTDRDAMALEYEAVSKLLKPHQTLLQFISSHFQATRYSNKEFVNVCLRLLLQTCTEYPLWSTHPLALCFRMKFVVFAFSFLHGTKLHESVAALLRSSLYEASLSWFEQPPTWTYGSNLKQLKTDTQSIDELLDIIKIDEGILLNAKSPKITLSRVKLLRVLLESERNRFYLWGNPLSDPLLGPVPASISLPGDILRTAWEHWPGIAIQLPVRFPQSRLDGELSRLVQQNPSKARSYPDGLKYLAEYQGGSAEHGYHMLFWEPVPVVDALKLMSPKYGKSNIRMQYGVRVLEHHPVSVTFFYVPQVVQALRTDDYGYIEQFIFFTSQISQLFCHQIIWNMKANMYRGDSGEEEDPMRPTLERVSDLIVQSLSGEAKGFYEREFAFFDEVTSISGKLRPYIKKSKPEKKAKIDEEIAKIKVDSGVYLPSNPDGSVVDIDRQAGRPLQSHAKAPFMATFKVRRELKIKHVEEGVVGNELDGEVSKEKQFYDTWQSAIFKVGDDCRQDVLALQIIAMHKNIFTSLGLPLMVTPYRVTATAPGCGVIDVVPNATSRDEMGRAKVNDLKTFFNLQFGPDDSVAFQKARINFIQSMAAYSLVCYIIQIKDRHNGNIMIDGRGCITHIDFGFLFDIGPGGVKFEPNSFKLSHEMVNLMGGKHSTGFKLFSELTVKAFLACRPYAHQITATTSLMLSAEFPSFKGEATIGRLLDRFKIDMSETDAADYMRGVISNACENPRSIVYDEFQRMTNGIPYAR